MARAHPDDRAMVQEAFDRSVADCSEFAIDYRIVRSDGAIRFIHARGRTFCDGRGRATRSIGSVQDVTERTETEATLQFANTLLRTEMEHSPDGMLVVGPGRRILSFNAKFAEMWRAADGDARVGRPCPGPCRDGRAGRRARRLPGAHHTDRRAARRDGPRGRGDHRRAPSSTSTRRRCGRPTARRSGGSGSSATSPTGASPTRRFASQRVRTR